MPATKIVISVGTSLLTNNQMAGNMAKHEKALENELIACHDPKEILKINFIVNSARLEHIETKGVNLEGLVPFSTEFLNHYLNDKKVSANIIKRKSGDPANQDTLPAEISSLFLYYYDVDGNLRPEFKNRLKSESDFSQKDHVILLTTPTADSIYCACILKIMIENLSWFKTKCEVVGTTSIIDDLDARKPANFKNGLRNLYDYLESVKGEAAGMGKLIIRTGGFKEVSAELKLLAISLGFDSFYLFEDSTNAVIVENQNLAFDYMSLLNNFTRVA